MNFLLYTMNGILIGCIGTKKYWVFLGLFVIFAIQVIVQKPDSFLSWNVRKVSNLNLNQNIDTQKILDSVFIIKQFRCPPIDIDESISRSIP